METRVKRVKLFLKKTYPRQIISAAVDEDLNDVVRCARPLLRGPMTWDCELIGLAPIPPPSHRGTNAVVIVVVVLVVRPRPRLEPARVNFEVDVADVAYGARPPRSLAPTLRLARQGQKVVAAAVVSFWSLR